TWLLPNSPAHIVLLYVSTSLVFQTTIKPTPTTTLFPYTTLFRSNERITSIRRRHFKKSPENQRKRGETTNQRGKTTTREPRPWRSEEHTSELQSRREAECRLLLEQKKHDRGPPAAPPARPALRYY